MRTASKFYAALGLMVVLNAVLLVVLLRGRLDQASDQPPAGGTDRLVSVAPPSIPFDQAMAAAQQARESSRIPRRPFAEDADGAIARLIAETAARLDQQTSEEDKMRLLVELRDLAHPQMIDLSRDLFDDPNPVIRATALRLLAGYTSPEVVGLAERGMRDDHPGVRAFAAQVLTHVNLDNPSDRQQVADLLRDAIRDTQPQVREAAIEAAEQQPYETKLALLQAGLVLPYGDIVTEATGKLEALGNKDALESLFAGLDNPEPVLKAMVNASIYFLISQRFPNTQEAQTWWAANRDRYDDTLFVEEP